MMSEVDHNTTPWPSTAAKDGGGPSTKLVIGDVKGLDTESLIEIVDNTFLDFTKDENTSRETENIPTFDNKDEEELSDEERMLLYEKAMHFKGLGSLNHALLCFLGCLQGLQPSCKSKFTMLPQCLTHIAEIYAHSEDYEKGVEFMKATKLYYEIAIIEAGIQDIEYKKETDPGCQPIDLDPCLDEAKRANEYEKLAYSCLEHKKFQLALDYCGKATKLRQQVYGDDHPITSQSLDLFTLIYAEMGKCQYGEALKKYGDLTKVIEEEKKESNTEQKHIVDEKLAEQVKETKEDVIECTSTSTVVSWCIAEGDSLETFEDAVENIEESVKDDCSIEEPMKEVTFGGIEDIEKMNEGSTRLITSFQLLIIFVISAFVSVFLTWFWCYISGSNSCPSKNHIYAILRYLYYVYLVPPPTDGKFY